MKIITNHKHILRQVNILIIISFIIISITEVILIWPHNILNGNDLYFHLERMEELVKSNTLLPRFNFHSFSDNGSAVMTMYPYLLLYPFSLIIKITKNVQLSLYLMYIVNAFCTLLISYLSCIHLSKNRNVCYIFSLVYSLSFEYISINFWSCDIGMSWSATVMPLVIFGFIYYILYSKWKMLSIGMSLLVYSNVSVSLFTPVLLLIWLLFNCKLIGKKHVLSMAKAIMLVMLTTALFWIPALQFIVYNHNFLGTVNINGAAGDVNPKAILYTLNPMLSFKFNSWWPWELTIPSFIGLVLATIRFRHLTRIVKQFYLFSVIVLFLSSSFFIWESPLMYKFGGLIQTTIRLYLIPQILLSYIFTTYIERFINKLKCNSIIFKNIFIIICVILLQLFYINIFHSQQNTTSYHHNGILNTSFFRLQDTNPSRHIDYYVGSVNLINKITKGYGLVNDDKLQLFNNDHNRLKVSFKKNISKVNLPILMYKGQDYKVYVDNKLTKSFSNKKLLSIRHVHRGTHYIYIRTVLDKTYIVAEILTGIGLVIYMILFSKYIYEDKSK